MAEKNHTLCVQFFEEKIHLCQKHDEVTRFDGTAAKVSLALSPLFPHHELLIYEAGSWALFHRAAS